MTEKDPLKFQSGKFSDDEFSDNERSEFRERAFHYDNHFLSVDQILDATGLRWVSSMAKGFPAFVKAFATITIVGAGMAAAKTLGLI